MVNKERLGIGNDEDDYDVESSSTESQSVGCEVQSEMTVLRINYTKNQLCIPKGLITRCAPSPTGQLHIGHVAHLMFLWGTARATTSKVLLRMEDHDKMRCRREYEASIIQDLEWLGFKPDRGFGQDALCGLSSGDHETPRRADGFRQSDNPERYKEALQKLKDKGLLYGCSCSRRDLAARYQATHSSPLPPNTTLPYDGYCRDRALSLESPHGIRLKLPNEPVEFVDLALGKQVQHPLADQGDTLLKERTGLFTYQFTVVVDDIAHGINLIVRGADILDSTGRQILLMQLLGREQQPLWLHHPLIFGDDGQKLSKRFGSETLESVRKSGVTANEVLGQAACSVGLLPEYRPLSQEEALQAVSDWLDRQKKAEGVNEG